MGREVMATFIGETHDNPLKVGVLYQFSDHGGWAGP